MNENMYDDEPWAKLALAAGFKPFHTESAARMAFRFCADVMTGLLDEPEVEIIRHRLGFLTGRTDLPLMIEVFPLDIEGAIADRHDDVDHWDVLVRPDGQDPIFEFENLTRAQAEVRATEMKERFPYAHEDWQLEDLLH